MESDRWNRPADLPSKHHALEDAIRHGRERFISDWNGTHPYLRDFLGPRLSNAGFITPSEAGQYVYFDEQPDVVSSICELHQSLEGLRVSPSHIIAGPGSSSLLAAIALWLRQQGHCEMHYLPPVYFTVHYFKHLLNLRLIPLSRRHVFEPEFSLSLPQKGTVLLLTDPVWFAGYRVPLDTINAIGRWQQATGSLVLIDGSFQFMQWDRTRAEHSSMLDPELTFRIISPTKALGIPHFRFAYLLHPTVVHRDLLFLYESMIGGASIADLAFARRSLEVLNQPERNYAFTDYLAQTFTELSRRGIIRTAVPPDCGYFVFGETLGPSREDKVMDQSYFELEGYPLSYRINLMRAREMYLPR